MRILYFDIWSPDGHKVFNDIHIKALNQLGDVYTIFKEGYYKYDYPHVFHFLDIPSRFYVKGEGYYKSRIRLARMIRWVWRRVSNEKWDYIVLASYDPLALFLSGKFKTSYVIDHNTIRLLDSRRLGFPFHYLSKDIHHIVFNGDMESKLKSHGIYNISIVPHGFIPMKYDKLSLKDEESIRRKYKLGPDDLIVFMPSLSISTTDVVGRYIYNEDFNTFLEAHKLKMITKSSVPRKSKSNIIIVDGYLPQEEYNYIFLHSACNILFYSQDFKYRTSGVLNECFANNIPCIFMDNPALKAYLPYIDNEAAVFSDTEELKQSIVSVLGKKDAEYYRNLEEIEDPFNAWSSILK